MPYNGEMLSGENMLKGVFQNHLGSLLCFLPTVELHSATYRVFPHLFAMRKAKKLNMVRHGIAWIMHFLRNTKCARKCDINGTSSLTYTVLPTIDISSIDCCGDSPLILMLSALRAHLRGIHKRGRSQDAATRKPWLLQPQSRMSHVAHTHERTHTEALELPSHAHPERHMSQGYTKLGEGCGLGYLPALLLTFAAKVDIINLQRVADNGMCVWCVCVCVCVPHALPLAQHLSPVW